jgi:hypothetical protein
MASEPRHPWNEALLIDGNLFFASGVQARLRAQGIAARVLAPAPGWERRLPDALPGLLLVNLTDPAPGGPTAVRVLRERPGGGPAAILGYAGHVEHGALQAGREAGCSLVAPNSTLDRALPRLLERLAGLAGRPAGGESFDDEEE